MSQVRAETKAALTAEQRARLTLFVDALGDALKRQRRVADDGGKIIVYIDSLPVSRRRTLWVLAEAGKEFSR